jgi:arabinofuranosyltransferase
VLEQRPRGRFPLIRPSHLTAVALLGGLATYVAWANLHYAYDDAFITYRVAHNFATGQGFVYNVGERVFCITAPGLGLLLGVIGGIVGPGSIPLASGLVSAVATAAAGAALYAHGALHGRAVVGLLAGLFFIASPITAVAWGGEMPLQIALILWAFVAYAGERRIACALLLAAATVVRPDGVLAAAVIGGYDLVRTRRVAWRAWLAFALALLPFVALAWAYFGSPIPLTLSAKLAQRDLGWPTFGRGLRNWLNLLLGTHGQPAPYEFISWDPRALGFWVTLGLPALLWYRFLWLPLAWVGAFVLSYRTMQVPFYHWYAASAVVGIAALAACGIDAVSTVVTSGLARLTRKRTVMRGAAALGTTFQLLLFVVVAFHYLRTLPVTARTAPLLELYAEAGKWLQSHSSQDASVGYFEIGYLGYHAQRRIIDPLGLLDPAIPAHLAQGDMTWAYRTYEPTYLVEQEISYGDVRKTEWFQRRYQPVQTLKHPSLPDNSLTIYRRAAP